MTGKLAADVFLFAPNFFDKLYYLGHSLSLLTNICML